MTAFKNSSSKSIWDKSQFLVPTSKKKRKHECTSVILVRKINFLDKSSQIMDRDELGSIGEPFVLFGHVNCRAVLDQNFISFAKA